jgi:hypothetical protein
MTKYIVRRPADDTTSHTNGHRRYKWLALTGWGHPQWVDTPIEAYVFNGIGQAMDKTCWLNCQIVPKSVIDRGDEP